MFDAIRGWLRGPDSITPDQVDDPDENLCRVAAEAFNSGGVVYGEVDGAGNLTITKTDSGPPEPEPPAPDHPFRTPTPAEIRLMADVLEKLGFKWGPAWLRHQASEAESREFGAFLGRVQISVNRKINGE